MSSSPQEKEKLRKRLQKLFQKQNFEKYPTGVNGKSKSQTNSLKTDKMFSKNKSNQKIMLKKNQGIPDKDSNLKQYRFVQTPSQMQPINKNSPKSDKSDAKKYHQKNSKIIEKQNLPDLKSNKKALKHIISPKQDNQPINTKHVSPSNQNETKVKENTKQIKSGNNILRTSPKVKTKNLPTSLNNEQQKKTAMLKQVNSVSSGQRKLDKKQTQKSIKRTSSENISKSKSTVSNKKFKFKNANNISTKPFSSYDGEQYVNGMPSFVRGGDFDSDSKDDIDDDYLLQEDDCKNYDSESESDKAIQRFQGNSQTDLEKYESHECLSNEDEYFDSDEYDEFDDSYEEEMEEENYSDFDENDYEEDEDSYNYSTDSGDDNSLNYYNCDNNSSYDFNDYESDTDYMLPEHIPEDLIIHKGTATKREINPEENIAFDSEGEEIQVVELESHNKVKTISQPKAYEREELLKLAYEKISLNKTKFQNNEATSSDTEDCPKLVPIVDEDDFQLYNPNEEVGDEEDSDESQSYESGSMEEYDNEYMDDVSLRSEYVEINSDDADSLLSEDINVKYLKRGHNNSDSDRCIEENVWNKKHKVDIIDATGYICEKNVNYSNCCSDSSLNDDIKEIPSVKLFENVDLKTKSTILSTTIINDKIFKSNDKTKIEIKAKTPVVEEVQKTEISPKKTKENLLVEEMQIKSLSKTVEEIVEQEKYVNMEDSHSETEDAINESPKIVNSTGQRNEDFNTKFFNALDSNLVIVLLKDPFYIYGTVCLTLLAGYVEVYGHPLTLNTEVEIFSPRGCSVIEISATTEKNNMPKEHLKQLLKNYEQHFALRNLETICDLYNFETDAVILLKRNYARKKAVQQFQKFMNENVFPYINNINIDRRLYKTEYLLRCMINISAQEQKCLRLPKQWQQLSITQKSRVMLTGGKSVGKSTLLRYLINRQLPQEVLLIDLDIGQPEVFIPQTVSCTIIKKPLLGPGFMLNLNPEISYAVGHTNIALCAHTYLAAVQSLITDCKTQEKFKDMPWLINTMGYNKGFGLELISIIAQELFLTDLIQLQSSKQINNFDEILYSHVLSNVPRIMFSGDCDKDKSVKENLTYRLHVWQSAVQQESRYQKEWEMSAKDMRFAILLARLSEALQGHAEWLTDIKPLCASLNEINIINLMDNTPLASKEELAKAVEANLVYLCKIEENHKPKKCLGIGVVRAVDFHIKQLYLIPAVSLNQLKEVNCVALGEMPLPTSLFTNQGSKVKNTAPFVYNTVAANASKAIKQIYHRPSKFQTGKHKLLV